MQLRARIKQLLKLAALLIGIIVVLLIVTIAYAAWHHRPRPAKARYASDHTEAEETGE